MMRSRLACAVIVAGLAAAAAGCGSSSSAKQATTTAPGAPGAPGAARFQELAKCMRSKGVKLPERRQQPGSGPLPGLNLSDPKLRQALLACRTQVFGDSAPGGPPNGPPGGAPPGQGGGTVQ